MKQHKKIDWMTVADWLEKHLVYQFGMMRSTVRMTGLHTRKD